MLRPIFWLSPVIAGAILGGVVGLAAAPMAAEDGAEPKVRISKKDCERILRRHVSADAAYVPGVDVRGRKVAGADVEGSFTIPLPDVYEFTLTNDLSIYLDDPRDALEAKTTIGSIRFNIKSGHMTFNGKTLTEGSETELAERCKVMLGR